MSGFHFNAINLSLLSLCFHASLRCSFDITHTPRVPGYPGGWLFLRPALIFMFVCRRCLAIFLGFLFLACFVLHVYVFPVLFCIFLSYLMAFLAWFIFLACVRDPTPSDKHAAATVAGLPATHFPHFPHFPHFQHFPRFSILPLLLTPAPPFGYVSLACV